MNQNTTLPFEIIVHDDASTDGSIDYIKSKYPDVRLIASSENVGFCVSNNRMAAQAKGEYLLLLNNDAELLPDALRTFYKYAEAEEEASIFGLRQFTADSGELVDFGIFLDPFLNSVPNLDLQCKEVGMIMGACMWVPKKLWEDIGGFPDWFHTMHEDMFLCCMARLLGYSVRVIPESGYRHWVGKSLGGGKVAENRLSIPIKRRAMSERNRIYVIVLCYPGPLFYFILPVHLILLMIEGTLLAIIKKNTRIFNAIYLFSFKAFFNQMPNLFRLRREIQKKKKLSSGQFLSIIDPVPHKIRMLLKHGLPELT